MEQFDGTRTTLPFCQACTLLSLRTVLPVQQALEQEAAPYVPLERVYLLAWSACVQADEEASWQTTATVLQAAHEALLEANVPGTREYFTRAEGTIRRRRPWICWMLGHLAFYLGVPQPEHAARALRFMDERRMNIPWLRVQAMCGQARSLLRLGASHAALAQYHRALSLCQKGAGETHDVIPTVYAGLCEAAVQEGDDATVLRYAPLALVACQDQDRRAHLLMLLGHVYARQGRNQEARTACQDVLVLTQNPNTRVSMLLILALCSVNERDSAAARRLCVQALQEAEAQDRLLPSMRRDLYLTCGKVALAESREAPEPPEAGRLAEESLSWHLKALDVSSDAKTLDALATLLDDLLRASDGQMSQTWVDAYRVLARHIRHQEPQEPYVRSLPCPSPV